MLHSREGDDAMTVWIVNPFDTLPFELSRPLRYWLMAEAFAKAGHAVTYWTADFNHVTKRPRDMAGADRGRLGGIDVRPVHEPPYRWNVGLKRLWAHWRWAKNWKAAAMKAPQPPEIVVASSPPLSICKEVRAFAKEAGAKVIMTRTTDTEVSPKHRQATDVDELQARCDVANKANADIFISIHMDSFTSREASGTTGYYYSKSTTGRGQKLADCIRRNLVEQLGTPSRGTQPCNFYVVKNTDMPATLIELGFRSNKEEEQLLNSKEGVQKAAQGILDGIEDYFG